MRGAPDARFPFLQPALLRFLEELPAPGNGLGRTEETILTGIAGGTTTPVRLFHQVIEQEEAAFMGDWSFFHILDDLASCDVPLIAGLAPAVAADDDRERFEDAELELTMAGDDVLAGEEDHVALSGLDRWWAGTRLEGRAVWRYDRAGSKLVAPGGAGGKRSPPWTSPCSSAARRPFPRAPARRRSTASRTRKPGPSISPASPFPEFTSICPVTGQPDFGIMVIDYVPGEMAGRIEVAEALPPVVPQPRRLPRGRDGDHRPAAGRLR